MSQEVASQAPVAAQPSPETQSSSNQGQAPRPQGSLGASKAGPTEAHKARVAAVEARKQAFLANLAGERREQLNVPAPAAPAEAPAAAAQAPAAPQAPAADPVAQALAKFEAQQAAAVAAQQQADAKLKAAAEREAAAAAKEAELRGSLDNPLEFISKVGMSEDDWKAFLTNGATLTPEQKKIKALEAQNKDILGKFQAMEAQRQAAEAQARAAQERSSLPMDRFPLLARMGGAEHAQRVANQMSRDTGAQVSLAQAAQHLENTFKQQLSTLLKDNNIAGILGINQPKQPQSQSAATPTTLGRNTAPTTANAKANPRDFAAKKARFLELLRQGGSQ